MAAATRENVLEALSRVIDPASGQSVIKAGLIQGLVLREGHVGFSVEVPPARGPQAEPLRKAAEDAVAALPGILSVTAVLTAHQDSAGGSAHGPGISRAARADAAPHAPPKAMGIPGVTHIIAVASGKGGVGKSTVAVNLALGLSQLGFKTGLLDADIYGPSVPRLLDIR
ncbi:MAG: P-loop NTPase, partial [Rhizomicrobium sp.]